jgi:hypothetical protein
MFYIINKTHQVFAVVAAERDVKEFGLLSQLPEARADVRLEVVPPEKNRIGPFSFKHFSNTCTNRISRRTFHSLEKSIERFNQINLDYFNCVFHLLKRIVLKDETNRFGLFFTNNTNISEG